MNINWFSVALGCFASGFVGTTGVGGSIFLSSALLILNLEPIVAKSIVITVVFMATIMNIFLFYFSGFSDPYNSAVFGICCFIGSVIGNQLITHIKKKKGEKEVGIVISLLMFVIIVVTLGMMPFTTYIEIKTNNSVFEFGEIC